MKPDLLDLRSLTLSSFLDLLCETETWRPVIGWPNYSVSSFGRVRGAQGTILTPGFSHGYHIVTLCKDGVSSTKRVHKLVVVTFIGPAPFEDAEVAHNDGIRTNNNLRNLRWATKVDNQADRLRHGTHLCGSGMRHAKLQETDIPLILSRVRSEAYPTIAKDFGVSISTIHLIAKGKTWKHVSLPLAAESGVIAI